MADENLSPREEANGFQTPAFERFFPRRVSKRAKNNVRKFAANRAGERVGGIFLFRGLWGNYETIYVVPHQVSQKGCIGLSQRLFIAFQLFVPHPPLFMANKLLPHVGLLARIAFK